MGAMRNSRLIHDRQNRLTEHFASGSTARTAASLCGAHRKTATSFFLRLREIIGHELENESVVMFGGKIEVDEVYFGGNGKHWRGTAGKVPVSGLLNSGGMVFAKIIQDASGVALIPTIKRKVTPDSIVYSDGWRGCDVLDVPDVHHFRINHSKLVSKRRNHINGLENFRNQAKCLIPRIDGAICSLEWKEALWDRYATAAPGPGHQRQNGRRMA